MVPDTSLVSTRRNYRGFNLYQAAASGKGQRWTRISDSLYLEPDNTGLHPSDFRQGHTVAILYPHQHGFLDFSVGIRQEEITRVQVIPLSLSDLFALSDRVQDHKRLVDGKHECHACGARKESLVKCGKCSLFRYCDKVRPTSNQARPSGQCPTEGAPVS